MNKKTNKEARISVRVSDDLKARVTEACKVTRLPETVVVEESLRAFCDYVEKHKCIVFPLTMSEGKHAPQVSPGPGNVVQGRFIQPERRTGTISLPELGSIAAGDEDQMEELLRLADFHIDVPAWYQDLGAAFVLRVKGDSMNASEPTPIFPNDRVIMALRQPQEGEIIAALIDGKTTLKRFVTEQGRPLLVSESSNPRHRNIIPLEGLEWKGVMVGKVE